MHKHFLKIVHTPSQVAYSVLNSVAALDEELRLDDV